MKEKIKADNQAITFQELLTPFYKEANFAEKEELLSSVIQKPREFILAHPEEKVSAQQKKTFLKLLEKLTLHQPLAYILEEKEFFGLSFEVNQATLIPRPETELLVEKILNLGKTKKPKILLEIGTGSGCIIISLARKLKEFDQEKSWSFLANDFSSAALKIAQKNSRKNQTEKLIDFFSDNLLGPKTWKKIQAKKAVQEIILVANLPYISEKEYSALDSSVKDFEPASALLSGTDGFEHYRQLLHQLKNFFPARPKLTWKIFWEIGYNQKALAQKEIQKVFPRSHPVFTQDLAGHWRVVEFEI